MLQIIIPATEYFDERTNLFVTVKEQKLQLEHSLVSLAKWESKWKKPFLSKDAKTVEETRDYVRCMTITQNVDPMVYMNLRSEQMKQIKEYIEDPMTATWFNERKDGSQGSRYPSKETITAELIYYWMIALQIPSEYQKWHLNRLLTLIRVCNIKNQPVKKMSKRDVLRQNSSLNAARKARMNTRG